MNSTFCILNPGPQKEISSVLSRNSEGVHYVQNQRNRSSNGRRSLFEPMPNTLAEHRFQELGIRPIFPIWENGQPIMTDKRLFTSTH